MNNMITAVVKGILWSPEYYLRLSQLMLKHGPVGGIKKAQEVAQAVVDAVGDSEVALDYQQHWEKLWDQGRYLELLNNVGSLVLTLQEHQMARIRLLVKEG